jgi:hypothetical protein
VGQADRAVHNLLAAGFSKDELAVICSDEYKEQFFKDLPTPEPSGTYTPQGIVAGGAVGAIGGLAIVTAAAAATGGLALLATAPLLMGGGALVGSFAGAMAMRGAEKEPQDFYDQAVRRGKILVAAEVQGENSAARLAQAERILADAGAEPIPLSEG